MSAPGIESAPPAAQRLLELLAGKWVSAALSACAELGIPDLLAEKPMSAEELAERLGVEAAAVTRVLELLVSRAIFSVDRQGRFSLTETGEALRSDGLGKLAVLSGSRLMWDPFSRLADSLRKRRAAFELHHGAPLFEHLEQSPSDATLYHEAIDAFTRVEAKAIASTLDLSDVEHFVDVGGGRGTLLVELLERYPRARGTLLDLESAARSAKEQIDSRGLGDRCTAVCGDFFVTLPEGADLYILKHILHNWPDDAAASLLDRVRSALAPNGRILVIDGVLLPPAYGDATRLLDLEMFALFYSARERSKPALRKLFHGAGLRIESTHELLGTARVFVLKQRGSAAP